MSSRAEISDLARKKIVILISAFERGGCERQAYLLAREMRRRHGLDAEVWALKYGGEYAKEFEVAGIPTRVLDFRGPTSGCIACGAATPRWMRGIQWIRRVARVARQLRERKVDILLPFTTWPNVVAGLAYKFAGVKLCIWGERHAGGERVHTPERLAIKRFRQFVANSTAGVEFLASEMRVPRELISFVPNGVELPNIVAGTGDWRARLSLNPGQLLVVKVANVTEYKDHATLLRGWKIVQEAWTDRDRPLLVLAGRCIPDHVYDNCRKIMLDGGLESTVRFIGSISDVPVLLKACDLTAFSSPNEGMPNGVMECMAAGKAIVASDLPGVRDLLGPDGKDVIFPPGDHFCLAQILLELLRNKKKREALGEANLARVQTEFSVERMAERHLGIIRKALLDRYQRPRGEALVAGEQRAG